MFAARNRQQIRDSLLSDWASRYLALNPPVTLLTIPGSDAYMFADALALEIEGLESQAATLTKEILPDQADTDYLNRHGSVDGVTRNPAVAWSGKIQINGTPAATVTFGTSVLVSTTGLLYGAFTDASLNTPIASIVLDGAGHATIRATCSALGLATTLPDATTLTWSSAPANALSTAAVIGSGTVIQGADTELDSAYAARIILRRQSRPASGNRADWYNWAVAVTGVADACVYPLYSYVLSQANTPGCVTVVVLGPVAADSTGKQNGDAATNTRFTANAASVGNYIEGTGTIGGTVTTTGAQLRPVTMLLADYTLLAPTKTSQVIELQLVQAAANAFPWTYNAAYLITSSTGTTAVFAGDLTGVLFPGSVAQPVLIKIPSGTVRGNYLALTPTSVVFAAGSTTLTFAAGALLGATPVVGSVIAPAPSNWQQIRLAVFSYIDSLGPGDTSPASRWPSQEQRLRSVLYKSALAGAVIGEGLNSFNVPAVGATGVLSATVVQPATDLTPAAFAMYDVSDLFVHQ